MRPTLRALQLAFVYTALQAPALSQGDCLTTFQFPSGQITADPGGAVTQISTCNFPSEYSNTTNIVEGATYQFTANNNTYITVRQGTFDGPVIGQGVSPVTVTAVTNGNLFAHYTLSEMCNTANTCIVTTVQLFLNCVPPQVSYTVNDDCDEGTFMVIVSVNSLGDGDHVDLVYTVGGDVVTLEELGTGIVELGPFPVGAVVNVVVQHEEDPVCNINLGNISDTGLCPVLIVCGEPAFEETYCYGPNDFSFWKYQSVGDGTMRLRFLRGTIESNFFDRLFIYDGPDATAPLLFSHTSTSAYNLGPPGSAINNTITNYYGIEVYASGPDLFMRMESDGSVQCTTTPTYDPWEWEVVCLDCTVPQATYTVVDDCANSAFSIEVDVASTGDEATVDLVYSVNGGMPETVEGVEVGITVLGPYTVGALVNVTVAHASNEICDISLGNITDTGLCPVPIVCGEPALEETYCYGPNDLSFWKYQSVGDGTMRLRFIRGTIESSTWDRLFIHDGPDETAPLLFSHTNTLTYNLGPVGSAINNTFTNYYGIEVYASGPDLFMRVETDGSVQCTTTPTYDPWEWEVVCLDCTVPQGTMTIVDDCDDQSFVVMVDVTGTGDEDTVNIIYTVNGGDPETLENVVEGETILGPFPLTSVIDVTLAHATNSLCDIQLGTITDTGTCPLVVECGTELDQTFCHGNFEDAFFFYAGTGPFPLALQFTAGFLETCCDWLRVYDGPDDTYPLLTPPQGINGNLAGQFFTSTNPFQALTVRVTTDVSISCQTGQNAQLAWTLSCLDCAPPELEFSIVQDCENFQYFIELDVSDLGTDDEVDVTNNGGAPAFSITEPGIYQVGPIVSGTPVQVVLVNDQNSLCDVTLPTLVNPLCPVIICGTEVIEEEYCYGPNENIAWAYEKPGDAGTLHLRFLRGTIESSTWDQLRIYDGPGPTSPLLFSHTNSTTYNLGPPGSAINNAISLYYDVDVVATGNNLYMELFSDGIIQCTSAPSYDPFEWEVYCDGCEFTGVAYNMVPDCRDRTFIAEVIVVDPPGPEGLQIVNTIAGDTLVATAIGVYEFGPYQQNDPIEFMLAAVDNPACAYFSDTLTYNSLDCVMNTCGFDNFEYCHGNDEDRWYTWKAAEDVPISIGFFQGQMTGNDRIVIYNGFDENAPVLFFGNNGGSFLGFAINSNNPGNAITMRIETDGSASCQDNAAHIELQWTVSCGAVGIEERSDEVFQLFPNPTNGLLYIGLGNEDLGMVGVRVLDMSGRAVIEKQFVAVGGIVHTIDLNGIMSGQYLLQMITADWTRTGQVQVMR